MTRLTKLRRFASSCRSTDERYFPYYDLADGSNPEAINAIYPQYEWTAEMPQDLRGQKRDWHFLWAVDQSTESRIEVFFERLPNNLAVLWAHLFISGDEYLLPEAVHRDYSDGSSAVYCAGGVRLECNAPLRRWRLVINAVMLRPAGQADEALSSKLENLLEVHVRFGAHIAMMCHPFEVPTQCSPEMIARRYEGLESLDQAKEAIKRCCSKVQAYFQGFTMYAEIRIDETDRVEWLFFGGRLRSFGISDLLEGSYFGSKAVLHHCGYAENGTVFHFIESTDGNGYGFCFNPTHFDKIVENCRLRRDQRMLTSKMQISFDAGGFSYTLDSSSVRRVEVSTLSDPSEPLGSWYIDQRVGELYCGEHTYRADVLSFKLREKYIFPEEKLKMFSVLSSHKHLASDNDTFVEGSPLVVTFSEQECRDCTLTGGKGSSLAILTAIGTFLTSPPAENFGSKEPIPQFSVPKGIVLTVEAYKEFLRMPEVRSAVDSLLLTTRSILSDTSKESSDKMLELKAASENCVGTLINVALPVRLEEHLCLKMAVEFGDDWERSTGDAGGAHEDGRNVADLRLAVRSSAVGEDSDVTSAAGQMKTLLNVAADRRSLAAAIVRCWASQFALESLSYRRNNGQSAEGPMAVVVQEMATAAAPAVAPSAASGGNDVNSGNESGGGGHGNRGRVRCAGILFTCDPVSGRPGRATITANYGLGESVVSASADPDTYRLCWASTAATATATVAGKESTTAPVQRAVTLVDKTCGSKEVKTMMHVSTDGTEDVAVPAEEAKRFCLTDEEAVMIARVCVTVCDFMDSPRDFEWALADDGHLSLLQARPVTSIYRETKFETKHDLNTALPTNREILTRSNLDEVTPGAFSPLALCVVNGVLFDRLARQPSLKFMQTTFDRSQYRDIGAVIFSKTLFLNLSIMPGSGQVVARKMLYVANFGYDISEHEVFKIGIFHIPKIKMINMLSMTSTVFKGPDGLRKIADQAKKLSEEFKIEMPKKGTDSLTLLKAILSQMYKAQDALPLLMIASYASLFYNYIVLVLLQKSQNATDEEIPEMLALQAKLLRSPESDIISARIPSELAEIARLIRKNPRATEFADMALDEALKFLDSDQSDGALAFRRFCEKHKHRAYKEFDLATKTWDIDRTPLVKTLQAGVGAGEPTSANNQDTLEVKDLKKAPSMVQRKLFQYAIPRAKSAVEARETAKSALVMCIHQLRLAFRRLGQQLVIESYLPELELIFFLTADEICRLIKTRNVNLVRRAVRRSRMHNELDNIRYEALFCGLPKSVDLDGEPTPSGSGDTLSGTPVSEGIAIGTARVVLNFDSEAHLIRKGDILITRATDTGWTPYFPLLAGVVTELGGLLSHGAVVAREFGLPAVVGVVGATKFFSSGATVLLDGNNGTVARRNAVPTNAITKIADNCDASEPVIAGSPD